MKNAKQPKSQAELSLLEPCPDCATKTCWVREFCEELDPAAKKKMLAGYEKDIRKAQREQKYVKESEKE